MLQCWCLGITYGQMLTYQLSTFSLVQNVSVINVHFWFNKFIAANLLMSLSCEHLNLNKQTLQKRGWISIQRLARHALYPRLTYGFTRLPVCHGTSLSCVSTFCWMYWQLVVTVMCVPAGWGSQVAWLATLTATNLCWHFNNINISYHIIKYHNKIKGADLIWTIEIKDNVVEQLQMWKLIKPNETQTM